MDCLHIIYRSFADDDVLISACSSLLDDDVLQLDTDLLGQQSDDKGAASLPSAGVAACPCLHSPDFQLPLSLSTCDTGGHLQRFVAPPASQGASAQTAGRPVEQTGSAHSTSFSNLLQQQLPPTAPWPVPVGACDGCEAPPAPALKQLQQSVDPPPVWTAAAAGAAAAACTSSLAGVQGATAAMVALPEAPAGAACWLQAGRGVGITDTDTAGDSHAPSAAAALAVQAAHQGVAGTKGCPHRQQQQQQQQRGCETVSKQVRELQALRHQVRMMAQDHKRMSLQLLDLLASRDAITLQLAELSSQWQQLVAYNRQLRAANAGMRSELDACSSQHQALQQQQSHMVLGMECG